MESIRFERELIPCNWPAERARLGLDTTVTQRALSEIASVVGCEVPTHNRERYTIRWRSPDGGENWADTQDCWHPLCDDSPWVFLMENPSGEVRARVLLDAWIRPDPCKKVVAVAYVLLLRTWRENHVAHEIVARIGIPDQWEDRRAGNNQGELFSRRYFAHEGQGVYPAKLTDMSQRACNGKRNEEC